MANEPAPRPNWLDDEFLKTCIISYKKISEDTKIDIEDVKLTYVVAKGENYMSVIYRVTLDYHIVDAGKSNGVQNGQDAETISFIVKVSHDTEHFKKITKEAKIFIKETDMYVNMMPKLSKLLEASGIVSDITCRCLYSAENDRDCLVMEDLKPKGYVLADRLKGLDLAHTKLVIDKLARVHAASKVDIAKNGVKELYSTAPFENFVSDEKSDKMMKVFEDMVSKKIASVILELNKDRKYKKQTDFYKKYEKLGFNSTKLIWNRIEGNKFNVLNHGDCWVNNMMFKYDEEGSIQNLLLVDFQMSYYSSAGNDFLYFFFSSTNDDVKRNHFVDIQKYYIERLVLYLRKLNYTGEIPTFEEFDKELRRLFLVAIYIITSFNAIVLNEFNEEQIDRSKSEAFEMEDIIEMTSGMSSTFKRVLLLSIDVLEENGYFESWQEPDIANNNIIVE